MSPPPLLLSLTTALFSVLGILFCLSRERAALTWQGALEILQWHLISPLENYCWEISFLWHCKVSDHVWGFWLYKMLVHVCNTCHSREFIYSCCCHHSLSRKLFGLLYEML